MNNTHEGSNNIDSNDIHFEKQWILKGGSLLWGSEGGEGGAEVAPFGFVLQ